MPNLRLVFVCSGNICRSPMAAGFAKHKAAERGIDVAVLSCGTLGIQGHAAARFGQVAMEEIGIDISDHYSQGVQAAIIGVADYVFVMAPKHEAFLLQHVPGAASKIVRTWEIVDDGLQQIDDPVGQDLAAFRTCRDLLDRCMDAWFEALEDGERD